MKQLTLGSLFDGIGGFCYAAGIPSGIDTGCTIKPLWAAEVEPNCIDITRYRFKDVMHVGSVTELKGDEIQPVDIITFGSPCQDLSIAGKRKGLKGNRSGLFIHAIRIIREMRLATNGQYPTFIIWENVPGAFSSNGGEDFRAVLEKVTNANIPMPASGKWATAGMVRGGEVDTAWRILDAQYWGVPQRRKRIYLIGDFGGQRAGEILFKCESVLGYTPKSKEQRAEAAGQSTNSLRAESSRGGEVLGLDFAHADSVVRTYKDITPTLVQNMGRGGGQTPCIMYEEKRSVMSKTDATEDLGGGSPCESASNKTIQIDGMVLADGTEVLLDLVKANYLNSNGIITALNLTGSFVSWGNETACYPANTDVTDYFYCVSRMFGWVANSVILSMWSKVDKKLNKRLIESVTQSINIWLNGLMAEEKILGGRVEFLEEENTTADLLAGKAKFHIYLTPPSPAKELDFVLEYDVSYLENIFA